MVKDGSGHFTIHYLNYPCFLPYSLSASGGEKPNKNRTDLQKIISPNTVDFKQFPGHRDKSNAGSSQKEEEVGTHSKAIERTRGRRNLSI